MGYFYDILDDFLSLVFPRLCHGCGNHLLRNEKLICLECLVCIPKTGYHMVSGNPVEQLFWGRCRIEKAAAFSYYTKGSRIRRMIHRLKYKGVRDLGPELGKLYSFILTRDGFFNGIDVIIPVPLHRSKERKRGFNQSELICRGISEVSGLPVDTESLKRISFSGSQTRKTRYERWKNVEGIFTLTDNAAVSGRHILLVDDVITTGSTIEACTSELLKAENVTVSVLALAVAVR